MVRKTKLKSRSITF